MSRTPYQINLGRIVIGSWIGAILLALFLCWYFMPSKPKEKIIREDKETGTKYVECEKWDEARFKDGTIMYCGNTNTEYEGGEINV